MFIVLIFNLSLNQPLVSLVIPLPCMNIYIHYISSQTTSNFMNYNVEIINISKHMIAKTYKGSI